MSKSWVITVEEADDGSGDLVLPLPEDLLEGAGWKEGDTLEWIDNKNGSWSLKKKEDDESPTTD
jgi:bifunctional DNA-binding transcriptional regulator/antitoxin component of YhaV-PrlF toxin-antitoxin module